MPAKYLNLMVPEGGVEPPQGYPYWILRLSRQNSQPCSGIGNSYDIHYLASSLIPLLSPTVLAPKCTPIWAWARVGILYGSQVYTAKFKKRYRVPSFTSQITKRGLQMELREQRENIETYLSKNQLMQMLGISRSTVYQPSRQVPSTVFPRIRY